MTRTKITTNKVTRNEAAFGLKKCCRNTTLTYLAGSPLTINLLLTGLPLRYGSVCKRSVGAETTWRWVQLQHLCWESFFRRFTDGRKSISLQGIVPDLGKLYEMVHEFMA